MIFTGNRKDNNLYIQDFEDGPATVDEETLNDIYKSSHPAIQRNCFDDVSDSDDEESIPLF